MSSHKFEAAALVISILYFGKRFEIVHEKCSDSVPGGLDVGVKFSFKLTIFIETPSTDQNAVI